MVTEQAVIMQAIAHTTVEAAKHQYKPWLLPQVKVALGLEVSQQASDPN